MDHTRFRFEHNGPVLITGAAGMVGTAFSSLLHGNATELTRTGLDVADEAAVRRAVAAMSPGLILNCAASTDVDRCETDEQYALAGNVAGPRNLARAAAACGARLVHFSTDYVFDGNKGTAYVESDPTGPLSGYGRTKLQGEEAVRAALPDALIVRTSWVYGPARSAGHAASFPEKVLGWARREMEAAKTERRGLQPIRVVSDQKGSPTFAADLAAAVLVLIARGASGTIHLGGSGCASRYEQARAVLEAAGLSVPLRPVPAGEFPLPARRPAHSCLDCSLAASWEATLSPWQDGLARFAAGLGKRQDGILS